MAKHKRDAGYTVRFDDGAKMSISEKNLQTFSKQPCADAAGAGAEPPPQRKRRAVGSGGGAAAAAGVASGAAVPIRGVWRLQSGGFRAVLCLSNTVRKWVGEFETFKAAVLALDQAARKVGPAAYHMLNFPETAAERDAVAAWVKRPQVAAAWARQVQAGAPLARKRSLDDAAPTGAAAAAQPSLPKPKPSPPPPKRMRPAAPAADAEEDDAVAPPDEPVPQPPAPAAAPAAAPVPAPAPAAAPSSGADDVEAFLRGIKTPPLLDLNIILAAVPAGMSMAHLTLVAQTMGKPVFAQLRDDLFKLLKVKDGMDKIVFTAALAELAPRDA